MKLIFLRHAQSEKNITRSFSSNSNGELLTSVGYRQASLLSDSLNQYIRDRQLRVSHVYCASSTRAQLTAKVIADKLMVDVIQYNELLSVTTDPTLKGRTEEEIALTNPQFIYELSLYRYGLFNAYNFSTVSDVTPEYEKAVMYTITEIISNDECEDIKIFVFHHSSLTAAIINIARKMNLYPLNFYGYIQSTIGNIYVIDYSSVSESFRFEILNQPPDEILRLS